MSIRPCKRCRTEFEGVGRATFCSGDCRYRDRMERVRSANRDRSHHKRILTIGRTHAPTHGDVAAECWCGGHIVAVPLDLVKVCQTRSCGMPGCGPELLVKRRTSNAREKC